MRRIALVLMAPTFVVVTVLATGPALAVAAQDPEEEGKEAVEAKKQEGEEAPVAKEEEKEAKEPDMPKTGGIITPYNAAFLALGGATALLVAGGLLVRRLAR